MPADGAPPLAGVRVVDFGHYIAGPLAGMLLADQGAEVVKVDRPGTRGAGPGEPAEAMYNRGKTRIELDLKSEAGLAAARRLIAAADVVIENFRPGVMDRLGLGAQVVTGRHPRLVYLSLPGFASTDQGKANIRAFEGVLNAACGLFTDLDSTGRLVGAPPVYTPIPLASTYGAIHGALAVTTALYARADSGRGEVIEVPLLSAALAATGILLYQVAKQPVRYGMPIMPRATQRFLVPLLRAYVRLTRGPGWRAILRRLGRMHPGPNDSYRTADGGWVFLLAGGNSNHSQFFLKTMGLYDELIEAGMVDRYVYDNPELTNNVQDWTMLSKSWKRRIRKRLAKLFAEQPAAHWVELLDGKVPFSPQLTADEWLHAPETLAAGLTVDVDDARHGKMRQLGVQVSLAGTADRWFDPRAAADGDLEAVLREWEPAPAADVAAAGAEAAGEGAAGSVGAAQVRGDTARGGNREPTERKRARGLRAARHRCHRLEREADAERCPGARPVQRARRPVQRPHAGRIRRRGNQDRPAHHLPGPAALQLVPDRSEPGQAFDGAGPQDRGGAGRVLGPAGERRRGSAQLPARRGGAARHRLRKREAAQARHHLPELHRIQRPAPGPVVGVDLVRPGGAGRDRDHAPLRRRRQAGAARLGFVHRLHGRLLCRLRAGAGPVQAQQRRRRRPGVRLPGAGGATGAGAVHGGQRDAPSRRRAARPARPRRARAGAPVPGARRLAVPAGPAVRSGAGGRHRRTGRLPGRRSARRRPRPVPGRRPSGGGRWRSGPWRSTRPASAATASTRSRTSAASTCTR